MAVQKHNTYYDNELYYYDEHGIRQPLQVGKVYSAGSGINIDENDVISITADYLSASEIENYYKKSETSAASSISAKFDEVTAWADETFLKEHQSLDGVSAAFSATSAWARKTFQPSGDYVSAADFNTFKESVNREFTDTSAWANQTFLTAHQSLDGISAAFSATSAWARKTFQPSGSYYQTFETSSKNEIQSALDLKFNIADMSAYQASGNYVSATVFTAYSAEVKQEFTNTSAWANQTFQPSGKYLTSASDEFAGKTIALKDNQWIEITAKDWTNEISAASANAIASAYTSAVNTSIASATTLINSAVDAINQEFVDTSAWANQTFQPSGNYITEIVTESPLSGKGTQDEPLSVNMSATYSTEFDNGLTAVLDTSTRTLTIQMTDEAWNDYQHLHTSASLWDSISALPVLSGLCITSAVSIVKGKFDLTENNTASGYDGIPFQQSSLGDYYTKSETSGKNEIQNALDLKQDVSGMSAYQLSGKYVTSASDEFAGKTLALKDNVWIEITAKDWTNEISAASANAITSAYTSAVNTSVTSATTLVNSAVNVINNQFSATSAWANNKFQPSGAYLSAVAVDVDAPIAGNGTTADPLRMDMSATYSTEFDKGITAVLDKDAHTLTIQLSDDVWNDYQTLHSSVSSWNNVSAYTATSGNFVTSAIAQFQDNIAYFLAKSGTSTVWSAVDIASVMSGTSVTVKSIREFDDVVGTHLNGGVEVTLEWNENGNLLTSSFSAFNGLNGADVMLYDNTTLSGNGDTLPIGVNTDFIATKQYVDNNFVPVTATTVAIGTNNSAEFTAFAQGLENSANNNAFAQGLQNYAYNDAFAQGLKNSATNYSLSLGLENYSYDQCAAIGQQNSAHYNSFAQGFINTAYNYGFAQGYQNTANYESFAQGYKNYAGDSNEGISFAQGSQNSANYHSFAQGESNYAYINAMSQGFGNSAIDDSFAQGETNYASGYAIVQGKNNYAHNYAFTQGNDNSASYQGLAQGFNNYAHGNGFAQGYGNNAQNHSFAQGHTCTAIDKSFAQGFDCYAENYSQAVGVNTSASYYMMAIGAYNNVANKHNENAAFVVGNGNAVDNVITRSDAFIIYQDGRVSAAGKISANGVELIGGAYVPMTATNVAIGSDNYVNYGAAFAQGISNSASERSMSQGYRNNTTHFSFAQGSFNTSESYSFAQGENNKVLLYSTVLGNANSAYTYSFAHGENNYAIDHSYAFGYFNKAYNWSMEIGRGLIFSGSPSTHDKLGSLVVGQYNKTSANALFVLGNGNGYATADRSDAFTVDLLGNVYAAGNISANGIDISATYATKAEVSAQLGDIETLLAAL